MVDTLGFPIKLEISAANVSEKEGLKQVYKKIEAGQWPRVIFADMGYTSKELESRLSQDGVRLEIVKKNTNPSVKDKRKRGFAIGPKRWIVERSFAWLGKFRRFSKDYELILTSSKALILMAFGKLLLQRIASGG
jgi:putative transposase